MSVCLCKNIWRKGFIMESRVVFNSDAGNTYTRLLYPARINSAINLLLFFLNVFQTITTNHRGNVQGEKHCAESLIKKDWTIFSDHIPTECCQVGLCI